MTTPRAAGDPDEVVSFPIRAPRRLKQRVIAYARAHTHPGAYGREQPMSLNNAVIALLNQALDAAEAGGDASP